MDPQHYSVLVSSANRYLSTLLYAVAAVLLVVQMAVTKYPLLSGVILLLLFIEYCIKQYRINNSYGLLSLVGSSVLWQNQSWSMVGRPLLLENRLFLLLKSRSASQYHHLWLASDSMSTYDWRCLRYHLLNLHKNS